MPIFRTQKKFFDAVTNGDEEMVADYLAKDPKWAASRDKRTGQYAIHLAAISGHAGIVTHLLKAGASTGFYDKNYVHPLHLAARNGHADVARTLLENGADIHINQACTGTGTPVQAAIRDNHPELLRMLLDTGKVDLNAGDQPPLYFAVVNKQKECLEVLLAAGADPNVPYVYTTGGGYDDDDYGYHYGSQTPRVTHKVSPLISACGAGNNEIAEMLLKAGAKALPDEFPLHGAAGTGNVALAALLVSYGINPLAVNSTGCTPLHSAISAKPPGLEDMVRFLLAQGVDKNVKDKDGRTALSYAQQFAQSEVISLLQGPLPAIAPTRPVVMPVMPPKQAANEPSALPPPVAMPAPSLVNDDDAWTLSGKNTVVHTTIFPSLGRRLTEIFNFEARERIAITENLTLKIETMGPHEAFDTISDAALTKAFAEFRRLGGQAEEKDVLGNRLLKMKAKL